MSIYKRPQSWAYDFSLEGHGRIRKGGFRTKAEAEAAEKRARERLIMGHGRLTFAEAHANYTAATRMADSTRDGYERLWLRIGPVLGWRYVEDVTTPVLDEFKRTLPTHLGPKSINQHMIIVSAVLRFAWKRGQLRALPYVPRERVPKAVREWYTQEERDRLLADIFEHCPQWYCFFYLASRLGLRRGELYALTHAQVRQDPPQLVVDRALARGNKAKKRPATVKGRKNEEAYVLGLPDDVVAAIKWHVGEGYAGDEYLFSGDGSFPVYLDSYKGALARAQERCGLRKLGIHALGRHSAASQLINSGETIKVAQALLGHRSEQSTHSYAHVSGATVRTALDRLAPAVVPHLAGLGAAPCASAI